MPMNFKLEIAWYQLIKSLAVGQSVVLFSSSNSTYPLYSFKILRVYYMYSKSRGHVVTQIALLEKQFSI